MLVRWAALALVMIGFTLSLVGCGPATPTNSQAVPVGTMQGANGKGMPAPPPIQPVK